MHSYQFHIGDYIKDAGHLSLIEDLAYRRLLDYYYDKESPIPNDIPSVSRRIRMGIEEVTIVLNEFFFLHDEAWHNKRCDEEIHAYHVWIDKQRANGKLGGRPKKTQAFPNANPNETQTEPKKSLTVNRKPLTNNQTTSVSHEKIVFDGSSFQNVNGFRQKWADAYPAVSIDTELAKAAAWAMANPKNKKSNWARFLTNWLSKAQDKAPVVERSAKVESASWIETASGITEKGKSLGIEPLPGEAFPIFKLRVLEATRSTNAN